MELILKNLKKTYGNVKALKGINYTFTPGVYGILGSNGAGKSTMINLITDNVKRDKNGGEILFCDDNSDTAEAVDILKLGSKFRSFIGYMPQQQGYYADFTPKAFLKYMADIKGVKKKEIVDNNGSKSYISVNEQIDKLLEIVNLKILILDEPTAGLDPKERIHIRNYIAKLSKDRIILFATHVVSDIECIADKVILLKEGQIIEAGSPVQLIDKVYGKVGEINCQLEDVDNLQKKYRVGNIRQRRNGLALRIVGDTLPEMADACSNDIDLEDVYLYYFGEGN